MGRKTWIVTPFESVRESTRSSAMSGPRREDRGATVLQGVSVGNDAVVAARAVVRTDVPPRTLVAGVPAQVVRAI